MVVEIAAPFMFNDGIGTKIIFPISLTATPVAIIFTGTEAFPIAWNIAKIGVDRERKITPIPRYVKDSLEIRIS